MSQNMQNERYARLGSDPIPSLIKNLAGPAIISMLISSFYNLTDTFFVSSLGTSATGAVGVVMPLMAIMQAVGMTFGTGAASLISRSLGQRNQKRAAEAAATAFYSALTCGILMSVYGFFGAASLVQLLGATETILPYALAYGNVILIGAPFIIANFTLNNILRSEGNAFQAMIGISAGVIINIILDPIFIFVLDMGIAGAAWATIPSQMISFAILLSHFLRGTSNLSLAPRFFRLEFMLYYEELKMGSPSLFRQGLAAISQVLMNQAAGPFGDAAIAAVSIVTRVTMMVYSAMLGMGQGFQPVAGFNYGSKNFSRLQEAFWYSVKMSTIAAVACCSVIFVFATPLLSLFRADDLQVVELGTRIIRLQALTLPFQAWVVITNMSYQAMGRGLQSFILALSRNGFCYIPCILILPRLFGLDGVVAIQATTDLLSLLIAIPLFISLLREIKQSIAATTLS
ncbi:MAG: MATE family efflux transporter [Symbiobacteriaceae bacterium]|nr:MATE family efflux transporter [Symbiobacteriaceae bacterium]